ncbi:MAG: glycine/D-amino acid oxidase-like deaminating enzyme [Paracoccaceae bacterium]|jgi:glycine/D-amino acid oxidase-like deaminating enzyme
MTLRRIYETAAYQTDRPVGSYWESTVTAPDYPALNADIHADVAIVGAGYTGLSAALHLAQDHGVASVVLDAARPGWGASGRNGGFCCMGGSAASEASLIRRYGAAANDAFTLMQREAVSLVASLLERHRIDADVQPGGEICLAHRARDLKDMRRAKPELDALLGVDCTVYDRHELSAQGLESSGAYGAMLLPVGFGLNPLKYAQGLAAAACAAGASVFGQSPVTGIDRAGGGFVLQTPSGRVTADRLIIATNGYSSENLPDWLGGRYLPVLSNIMVTRPLTGAELQAQGWTSSIMSYDSRKLLHYFRLLPDNRVLFGMRGNTRATQAADAATRRALRRDFAAMFPAWAGIEAEYHWSGLLCMTRDLVPYIGPVEGWKNAWTALAYHGNGVAMASLSGCKLAGLVAGATTASTLPEITTGPLPRFPFARFRRAGLSVAYPFYQWRDRG